MADTDTSMDRSVMIAKLVWAGRGMSKSALRVALARPMPSTTIIVDESDLDAHSLWVEEGIRGAGVVAVDVEGVGLSRSGPATWISFGWVEGSEVKVALVWIDAQTGDPAVVDWVCQLVAETDGDEGPFWLFWDVRIDSDALHHQQGITLPAQRVLDVQLLNAMEYYKRTGNSHNYRTGLDKGVSLVASGVGMGKEAVKAKLARVARNEFGRGATWFAVWGMRALPEDAILYAACDVIGILLVFACHARARHLQDSAWVKTLCKSASDVAVFRGVEREVSFSKRHCRISSPRVWAQEAKASEASGQSRAKRGFVSLQ